MNNVVGIKDKLLQELDTDLRDVILYHFGDGSLNSVDLVLVISQLLGIIIKHSDNRTYNVKLVVKVINACFKK